MKSLFQSIGLAFIAAITFSACNKSTGTHHPANDACCQKNKSMSKMTTNSNTNSLYQLTDQWENSQSQKFELSQLKGKVQLMAMVFTHCGFACPKTVANIKDIESRLPPNLKDKVGFVLVSFDVKRDTPQRLKEYATEHNLNNNWTLLHGDEDEVRTLSMLLNVQYNQQPDGNFDHSNILTVLDENGKIAAQFEGLDINKNNVVNEIEKIIQH